MTGTMMSVSPTYPSLVITIGTSRLDETVRQSFNVLFSLLAVLANLLIILTIVSSRSLHHRYYGLLCSLCSAEMLAGIGIFWTGVARLRILLAPISDNDNTDNDAWTVWRCATKFPTFLSMFGPQAIGLISLAISIERLTTLILDDRCELIPSVQIRIDFSADNQQNRKIIRTKKFCAKRYPYFIVLACFIIASCSYAWSMYEIRKKALADRLVSKICSKTEIFTTGTLLFYFGSQASIGLAALSSAIAASIIEKYKFSRDTLAEHVTLFQRQIQMSINSTIACSICSMILWYVPATVLIIARLATVTPSNDHSSAFYVLTPYIWMLIELRSILNAALFFCHDKMLSDAAVQRICREQPENNDDANIDQHQVADAGSGWLRLSPYTRARMIISRTKTRVTPSADFDDSEYTSTNVHIRRSESARLTDADHEFADDPF